MTPALPPSLPLLTPVCGGQHHRVISHDSHWCRLPAATPLDLKLNNAILHVLQPSVMGAYHSSLAPEGGDGERAEGRG